MEPKVTVKGKRFKKRLNVELPNTVEGDAAANEVFKMIKSFDWTI